MQVQPSFICYLVRYKLCVMSRGDTFVENLVLLDAAFDSCVYELCHFWIVSEHVDRQLLALSYGDELFFIIIFILVVTIYEVCFLLSGAFESFQRLDDLIQMHVGFNIAHHQSTVLFAEEFSQVESVRN